MGSVSGLADNPNISKYVDGLASFAGIDLGSYSYSDISGQVMETLSGVTEGLMSSASDMATDLKDVASGVVGDFIEDSMDCARGVSDNI